MYTEPSTGLCHLEYTVITSRRDEVFFVTQSIALKSPLSKACIDASVSHFCGLDIKMLYIRCSFNGKQFSEVL